MSVRFLPVLAAVVLLMTPASSAGPQQAEVSPAAQALGQSWDPAYRDANPSFTPEPNAFLVQVVRDLRSGTALDVGMGQGRNAIFLARQGWNVTGFDVSQVGIQKAQEQAQKSGLTLATVVATDTEFDWGINRWDLIVLTYFPQLRRSMPKIVQSLKPGGVVVVEAYHADVAVDRPPGAGPGVTFQSNELPALAAPLEIVRYEEPRAKADWGLFETRLVRLVARKAR